MRHFNFLATICFLILAGLLVGQSTAAVTAEHKKELKNIGLEIVKVAGLIKSKKYDEAGNAIGEIEERIVKLIKDADLKDTDPLIKKAHAELDKLKEKLGKASGKGGVSFEKTVASIFAAKCVSCHGEDDPKGGLRLDTFEGLEKGGSSGNLLIPGNVEGSLLMQRVMTPEVQYRMPKGKDPLGDKELKAIVTWINEGARFSGDKTASMASLAKSAATGKPIAPPPKIEKETGTETVHFTRDLMPELMDTCGRCHNDTVKRSGFSVTSFENLMKGGESGAVIAPGSLENSRMWRLVNADETPVMPAGNQTGITRKWHSSLRTWILEGAKYDGADAKKKFPTLEEREAMARANFSPEQWVERRKKNSEAHWKDASPKVEPVQFESADFLLYGDVTKERLEQVDKWATEQASQLRQTFKVKSDPLWTGKLAVFVFKDRFGYEEFNRSVHGGREVPPEVMGHSEIKDNNERVFIALQDIGDAATETSPGMQVSVIDHVTGAFLKRGGGDLPDWLIRGTGMALARQRASGNPYLAAMPRTAGGILQESKIDSPEVIFSDGTFSPGDVGPVGFTLVEFLLKRGSVVQFGQLIQKLQSGTKAPEAVKAVYQTEPKALALAYAQSLPAAPNKKGKKP